MATRGASGGLSRAVSDAIVVLDAAGYGVILVETVGAGQDEVAIARLAHTVVVVEAPGLGDDIQAIKAGLLEVADVIVVNKGDRDGADQAARFLEAMIERVQNKDAWRVSVCQTVALDGTGVAALVDQIEAHRAYLAHSGQWAEREKARARDLLEDTVREALFARFAARLPPTRLDHLALHLARHELTLAEALRVLELDRDF